MHPTGLKRTREEEVYQDPEEIERPEEVYQKSGEIKRQRIEDANPRYQDETYLAEPSIFSIFQNYTTRLREIYATTNRKGIFAHLCLLKILEVCQLAFEPQSTTDGMLAIVTPLQHEFSKMPADNLDDITELEYIDSLLEVARRVLNMKESNDQLALDKASMEFGQFLQFYNQKA